MSNATMNEYISRNRDISQHPYESQFYELLLLADLAYSQENYDDAVILYERALQYRRANPRVWYSLGQSYEALNKFTKAAECYRRM